MTRSQKALRWLLGATVLVIAGVLFVMFRLGLLSSDRQLQEELQLAKMQGFFLTPAELRTKDVPATLNAVPLIQSAADTIKTLPDKPDTVVSNWGNTWIKPTVTQEDAEKALRSLKPILDSAKAASTKPYFHPAWKWEQGLHMMMPEPGQLKAQCKILVADAKLRRLKGDFVGAADSLLAAARLGSLLSQLPIYIAILVREGIEAMVEAEVANLLRRNSSQAMLDRAKSILAALGPIPDIRFAMKGDFVLARIAIGQLGFEEDHEDPPYDTEVNPPEWKLLRVGSIRNLNEANVVKMFRLAYSAAPSNPRMLKSAESAIDDLIKIEESIPAPGGIGLSAVFVFSESAVMSWGECVARRNVLASAIEILESSLKSSRFPEHWSSKGDAGLDPFTASPLLYHLKHGGFVVYSVDKDGVDNGGRPYVADDGKEQKDISFEYPTLSARPIIPPKSGSY